MATKTVSILTGGVNSHTETAENANGVATDFISPGVVGTITLNTGSGGTGAFAINAQSTPDMTLAVTGGIAYVTGTPTSGSSQTVRVNMASAENVTIPANSSGSTRTSWIYIKLDPAKMKDPNVAASDVATLIVSDSSSSSVDDGTTGTAATYKLLLGKATVANGAVSITNSNITDSRTRTGAKTLDTNTNNAILANQLATNAITLGYAQITAANFTTTSTTAVQVTGLTTTVTIPAGGRRVKITAYTGGLWTSLAGGRVDMSIWDGTVGSGTQLQTAWGQAPNGASGVYGAIAIAVVTPSAGSKTYNVGLSVTGGTGNLVAATTQPAFILVEAI